MFFIPGLLDFVRPAVLRLNTQLELTNHSQQLLATQLTEITQGSFIPQ
jgi:hypothetical protein